MCAQSFLRVFISRPVCMRAQSRAHLRGNIAPEAHLKEEKEFKHERNIGNANHEIPKTVMHCV